MRSAMKRSALREIWSSFGRYFAILSIVALGVGFFSGVRITTPAMISTMNSFVRSKNMFDLRLVSNYGWNEDDIEFFREQQDVKYAEGSFSADAMFDHENERDEVFKVHSMPKNVNKLKLVSGRLPSAPDECVVDSHTKKEMDLNSLMRFSSDNSSETLGSFTTDHFKIVGTVESPLYINFVRGSTSLGNGSVVGFIFVPAKSFSSERYNDIYLCFDHSYSIYSSRYNNYISRRTEKWEELVYGRAQYSKSQMAVTSSGTTADRPNALTYVLRRNSNIGYASFESDSEIVEQVARVFPVFFILVAALVCMTTMSRMIEEQRTQIGIFKALGYSNASIMARFMFYSGSAAAIGCIIGYTAGTYLFPKVIWQTYKMMYVRLKLDYVFSPKLAASALIVSLAGSLGITYITCRYELTASAASLMRPKAPRAGKRVLLERVPFIWNRMKFLHKVSVRNIFRYKKRFFMMITGISGCTALLVTGFGIKDSIAGFADTQYRKIITADASLVYKTSENEVIPASLKGLLDKNTDEYILLHESSWEMTFDSNVRNITLDVPEDTEKMRHFMNFNTVSGKALDMPASGQALISNSLHDRYGISVGDTITLRNDEMKTIYVEVSGIFENHVYNYVFISPETMEYNLGAPVKYNTAYLNFAQNIDESSAYTAISKDENVVSHTLFSDLRERMTRMMDSLNYIVIVVIICAAGLAFIVLYNLTNINITERLREIATIKVLGFFRSETAAYVLRENIVMTAVGSVIGMFLGVLLHRFVMDQIVLDLVSFSTAVKTASFIYSIILTFLFNAIVNLLMQFKLERISMTESLKSVE